MAAIPAYRPVSLDPKGGEIPESTLEVANVLNRYMQQVTVALGGLTFQENSAASVQFITFTTPADYLIGDFTPIKIPNPVSGGNASGVVVAQMTDVDNADKRFIDGNGLDWITDQTNIKILYIAGLDANRKYRASILAF